MLRLALIVGMVLTAAAALATLPSELTSGLQHIHVEEYTDGSSSGELEPLQQAVARQLLQQGGATNATCNCTVVTTVEELEVRSFIKVCCERPASLS